MSESALPAIESKRDLAVELHRLLLEVERRTGGRGALKRSTLARRIGVSVSSLYAYLDGTTLPSTMVLDSLLAELGVPDAERRRLGTARDALEVSSRVRSSEPARVTSTPHELPPDVPGFTGRGEQLAELSRLLVPDAPPPAVVIPEAPPPAVVISGTGGVGKTALAVHWSYRIRDRFPDGQLYVDLRGYDPGKPVDPAEALNTVLCSLGVTGSAIPLQLDDRVARYRTLLDGRRLLVVLDNAASAEQVRPLLPGSSSCRVVITSRDIMAGLAARDGARRLTLDRLPPQEAVCLLGTLLGAAKVESDPQAASDLADCCDRLPLALRVAAELAASRPDRPLVELVTELRQHRLDLLDTGDDRTAIRGVFSWSYRQLPAPVARAFRLTGVHPGRDFDGYGLAALTGTDLETALRLAARLRNAHLIEYDGGDRFHTHDLLREYAAELAHADREPVGRDALIRLLDYYGQVASTAMDLAYPYEADQRPRLAVPRSPVPALEDAAQATSWLDTELANLLAAARAAGRDHPGHTLHLSATLRRHLRTRAYYTDAQDLHGLAVDIARRVGDRDAELDALTGLGHIHRLQARGDSAADCYQQALELASSARNSVGQLNALTGLGHIHRLQERFDSAADCYQQALELASSARNCVGQLNALAGLGHIHHLRGRHDLAADSFQRVLELARDIGDRGGELNALAGLGHVHRLQGKHDVAGDWYRQAMELARTAGHRVGELTAIVGLGDIHRRQGRHDLAADDFQHALELAGEMGDRHLEFEALIGIGRTCLATGHLDQALTGCQQALDLAHSLGQLEDTARAHDALACAYRRLGQYAQARRHWQDALTILSDLDLKEVEEVDTNSIRGQLNELDREHPEPW